MNVAGVDSAEVDEAGVEIDYMVQLLVESDPV